MKYDGYNSELTVDNLNLVNYDCIRSWIDSHIDVILSELSFIHRDYLTGDIDAKITVVCAGYVVAVYSLAADRLMIQTVGYNNCCKEVLK